MQFVNIRVFQGLLNCNSLIRIEFQHFRHQIDRKRAGIVQLLRKLGTLVLFRERTNKLSSFLVWDFRNIGITRIPNSVENKLDLMSGWLNSPILLSFPGSKGFLISSSARIKPIDQTSTAGLFTLTGFCIGFLSKKDFGGSIPPSSDIISHGDIVMLKLGNISSSEAKVTDFEVAVLIDKDILWFLDMSEISQPTRSLCSRPAEWMYFMPLKI